MEVQQKRTCAARLVIAMLLGLAMDAHAADPHDRSGQGFSPAPLHQRQQGREPTIAPRPAPADLTSRNALDAWRARHRNAATPLDALSPGARERLMDGLAFVDGRIVGVGGADLAAELTQPQIDAVLVWLSQPAGMIRSRIDGRAVPAGDIAPRRAATNRVITPTERRVNAFLRDAERPPASETDVARHARIARQYDAAFPTVPTPEALSRLGDADLRLLMRAAQTAAFYDGHDTAVDAMQALLPALRARDRVTDGDLEDLQKALLRGRRFDEARDITRAHPQAMMDRVPALRDAVTATPAAPTAWRLRDGGALLERERIDLSGTRIVVTAGCHFSQDAAADIATDPVLGAAFARHATWLMAAPGGESIDAVLDWNRRFPQAQALMRHDDDEWSLLPSFAMPTFYVIRDGRVIERVTGWSSRTKEQRQPLIDALSRSGLLAD